MGFDFLGIFPSDQACLILGSQIQPHIPYRHRPTPPQKQGAIKFVLHLYNAISAQLRPFLFLEIKLIIDETNTILNPISKPQIRSLYNRNIICKILNTIEYKYIGNTIYLNILFYTSTKKTVNPTYVPWRNLQPEIVQKCCRICLLSSTAYRFYHFPE